MNLQDRKLSQGINGDDVRLLQQELWLLGYVIADAEVTKNLFGETTLRAVIDFQKSQELTADGIVGVNTAKALSVALAGFQDPKDDEPKKSEARKSELSSSGSATHLPPNGDPKPPKVIPPSSYVIQGQIRQTNEQPAVGLMVRAFDKDAHGSETKLGESLSDQGGQYKITYDEELFRKLSGNRKGLDMILRVLDVPHNMHQEWNVIQIMKPVENLGMRQVTWLPWKEPETKLFNVSGQVRWSDGRPATDLTVRAFDKDMRSEEQLGQTVTDKQGHYQINYSASQFRRDEKGSADLIVRVSDGAGTLPVSSPIIFNAKPVETVDLSFGAASRADSEYETMIKQLTPLLEGVKLSELVENEAHKDISFLSGETGLDAQRITWLAQAARLKSGVATLQTSGIPAEMFYGWFRQGLPTDWEALQTRPLSMLRKALVDAIDQNIIPAKFREDVESILAQVPNPQIRELATVLGGAALSSEKIKAVLTQVDAVEAVSDELLNRLVEQKALAPREAELIGLNVSLHRLAGGEQTIVSKMLDSEFAIVKGGKLQQARDLASLEPSDWESVLESTGSLGPVGVSRADYARNLAMEAVTAFPHAAFVRRATRVLPGIDDKLNSIQPLLEKNQNAFALDFEALDLDGVNDSDREAIREAHTNLRSFANMHPGLGLHEVFSKQGGAADAIKQAGERIGWLSTLFDLNPDVSFLGLDYLPDSADLMGVKFGTLPVAARASVLKDLKAHQRIHAITNNAIPANEIMAAGFHSASAIARTRTADFTAKTGLTETEAQAYYAEALELANAAALRWIKLYDVARDKATTPIRTIPTYDEFFAPLEGFAELINDQPWCECEHCQSVLSPAAYFVDLMYYVEENILKESFNNGREEHPLHLKVRRPDLWDLELTCKNTSEYFPYLDVVNEILERYLWEHLPHPVGTTLNNHLYKQIAEQEGSFQQPFTLPIERLEILLGHFGLSRYDVAKAMGSDTTVQACARLKISKKEYDLITIARDNMTHLPFFEQLFKIKDPISISSVDAVLDPLEMKTFLDATGLAHKIVASVLNSTFVNTDGSTNAKIDVVLGKRSAEDVQNNSELVKNVTLRRLDRTHRFVRLWRKLPWTIEELDYVLERLAKPDLISRIDAAASDTKGTLERLLDLLVLNTEWSLEIDEVMALSDGFPEKGLRDPVSLFDRLFNQQPFLDRDGRWLAQMVQGVTPTSIRFSHPAWKKKETPVGAAGVSDPNNNTLSRLRAGLELSDKELVQLIEDLKAVPALDYRSVTATEDESILLSKESIRVLYRHARLMRLLKCSATDFAKLIKLTPRIATRSPAEQFIRDLDDVKSVIELAVWLRSSGFSLDEIVYVTGVAKPKVVPDPVKLAKEIVARVKTEKMLEFADTVFTQIGLTDLQSRTIVTDNLTRVFEVLPDGKSYRLQAAFDPALTTDVDSLISPLVNMDRLISLLRTYHPLDVLDVVLGSTLGLSPEATKELRKLAHPLTDVTAIVQAFRDGDNAGLEALLRDTLRYRALFKSKVFDVNCLKFVRNNRAVFFGPPNSPPNNKINQEVVRNVAAYVAVATAGDLGFTTASDLAAIAALHAVIDGVGPVSDEDYAKSLRTDKTRISALRPHVVPLSSNPFETLELLARCLNLTEQLRVSGETLSLMKSSAFDDLSRAAEDVFVAFRARYPNEKTFQEKIEPFEDKLRARKRDGLVDFIVSKWSEPFADANKLYEYFLIDVLLEGCARTSRLVAAISSLQLYVHRVLMNLEKSADLLLRKNVVLRGAIARFEDSAKRNEWYWREHYRVWEANRKVFLYPENYIEPELRDDKTPLFKELEDTLLQQEISDSNVHDAYTKYLTGFDEVARLKIAGAYYDQGTHPDRRDDALHLFGVTQDTPPVYYYRVINKTVSTPAISPWQKLTLQIPVRKVSPIVFEGRLYVFWMETMTRVLNTFVEGTSEFGGYRHAVRVKYSTLRLNGAWTPPQSLSFGIGSATEESRIIDDPQTGREEIQEIERQIAILVATEGDLQGKLNEAEEATRKAVDAASLADKAQVDAENLVLKSPSVNEVNPAEWILIPGANLVKDEVARDVKAGVAKVLGGGVGGQQLITLANALLNQNLVDATVALANLIGVFDVLREALTMALAAPYLFQRAISLTIATIQAANAARAKATAEEVEAGIRAALQQVKDDLAYLRLVRAEQRITVRWDKSRRDHSQPLDNYKPEGWEWDRVYPDVYSPPNAPEAKSIRLMLVPRNEMPATNDALLNLTADEVDLSSRVLRQLRRTDNYTGAELVTRINNSHGDLQLRSVYNFTYGGPWFYLASFWLHYVADTRETTVAVSPGHSDLQVVNGNLSSVIIESQGHAVWMRRIGASEYLGTRLGTTLTAALANQYGHRGASSLLESQFQESLMEISPKISPVAGQNDPVMWNPFHRTNAYLTYFREVFFHIPFVVANHLNSQQKFAETQRWYHYIFNPTAADGLAWRYRELRDPLNKSLREMLTQEDALAAYRADPFNPHAIARTRLSAYQKSIVMKYIDNLLDWGDSLFSQFTMESVNEATMLYVMAQDILGPRPRVLSSCGEGKTFSETNKKTYRTIRPGLNEISDLLIELEAQGIASPQTISAETGTLVILSRQANKQPSTTVSGLQSASASISVAREGVGPLTTQPSSAGLESTQTRGFNQTGGNYWTSVGGTASSDLHALSGNGNGVASVLGTESGGPAIPGSNTGNIDFANPNRGFAGSEVGVRGGSKIKPFDRIPPLDVKNDLRDKHAPGTLGPVKGFNPKEFNPVELVPPPPKYAAFCIPPNKDLLAYWGRVEDRLFKIRNCMDIEGVRRGLDLFAPEIDPRLLVRMKAAGLTLEDVLNSTSGNVPPYRFTYLIEKARQYAGTLQSFGAQLLSAFEKRDSEELAQLRAVHEQNLLKMRSRMMRLEIDAAEDAIEGLKRQKAAAEYRHGYFRSLSDVGLLASEHKQQEHQRQASTFRTQANVAQLIAAVLTIIPDVGAPTAMKFGGSQLGAAGRAAADGLNALAAFNEMGASMAGMESSNRRRDQDWKHQAETAKREISQIEKQITAAEIRREIAVDSLELHEKTIEQSEEIFDFFREKFSSLGRYTWLSNRLHALYRQAFNSALSMARMAEQAYRAERTDDLTILDGNYWDLDNAGLLAGERLLIDLLALERQYIEKNYRQLEIEQSFSLAQFAPDELAKLRLTGNCEFHIPEWFFDLTYPGQYRRRLKAARLTIPCVTGPYTNVGATLRLKSSEIRLTPLVMPTPVPLRHTVGMTSSKGQYDAGVFDFSFRDERYMPFEGAGAISTWQLSLPETLRVFDYGTISDVILHLSYTADFDGVLKETREDEARGLIALLKQDYSMTRLFSLRHEFPDVFHRLLTSPPNTEIDFTIEERHFPSFLGARSLKAGGVKLRVLSTLPNLVPADPDQRTTLVIGEKTGTSESPQTRILTAPLVAPPVIQPIIPDRDVRLQQFDFQNLPPDQPYIGVGSKIVGDYMIKLTTAGPLAPNTPGNGTGTIDPANLHDIILEIGYSLA